MQLLSPDDIKKALRDLPGWQLDDHHLRKEFVFPTFTDAMVFVNEVAQAAEDLDHHPDIAIHQNTVRLATTSHDVMGITERDMDIAKRAQDVEKMIFSDLSKA